MNIKMTIGGQVIDLTNGIATVDLDEAVLYAEDVIIEEITAITDPVKITVTAEIVKVNISDIPSGKHFYYNGKDWGSMPYFTGKVFKEGRRGAVNSMMRQIPRREGRRHEKIHAGNGKNYPA